MSLLRALGRTSGSLLVLAVLAGVVCGLSSTALLALIPPALRQAATSPSPGAVTGLAWAFASLCVVRLVSGVLSEWLLVHLSQTAVYELRVRLARRVLDAALRHVEEIGPQRILASLTDDVVAVTNAFAALPRLCINAAIVVGCLGYMLWLSPPAFGLILAVLTLGVGTYRYVAGLALGRLRTARAEQDAMFGHLRGLTSGAKELKIHMPRRTAFLTVLFEPTASAFRADNVAGLRLYALAANWGYLLFFVVVGLAAFAAPGRLLPVDAASGLVLALLFMMGPLDLLLGTMPIVARARVALETLDALGLSLHGASEASEAAGQPPSSRWTRIELRGVTHAYAGPAGDRFALGPLDVTLEPGDLLFVVGGNGSGKTTLVKLLAGLYAPDAGAVYLDGTAVDEARREDYRQLFSIVFADLHLFDRLLGLDGPDADRIAHEHLVRLRLDDVVQVNSGRFSTTDLSQGQRRRLAMLIAQMEDRPIYVFDEWAADQEPGMRDMFYRTLLPALAARGKAVVVISHDDRYFDTAGRVLRLERGRVVAIERPASHAQAPAAR